MTVYWVQSSSRACSAPLNETRGTRHPWPEGCLETSRSITLRHHSEYGVRDFAKGVLVIACVLQDVEDVRCIVECESLDQLCRPS